MTLCKMHNRPSVALLQLRLICLFSVNLVISSWCWTWPTLKTWNRFIKKYDFNYYQTVDSIIFNTLFRFSFNQFHYFFTRKICNELSRDERFTKPLYRVISDIYAKRNDDKISVSVRDSHTDPAGLNFDINNLNSTESNAISPSELNYICMNTMNRRNAMTVSKLDINELNANCATHASSYADNNSEISVSFRHFAIESRRSSFDSQVSVKMSEMNIKATLENHSQNDLGVHMKPKKRQHMHKPFKPYRRTSRRTSSSSIESQKITNQMRNIKYKRSNNRIQVNASTMGRQVERRRACTADEIKDIHRLLNRNIRQEISSDDDRSNDESRQMYITSDPSNMLVKYGDKHQMTDSGDSLDASNEKNPSIEQILKEFIRKNDLMKIYSQQKAEKNLENSFTSSLEQAMAGMGQLDGTRSSVSNHSMNRLKTQSQSSKRSCDIGIQANDFEINIASHAQNVSNDDCHKDFSSEKHQPDNDYTETHQLLTRKKRDDPSIVRKDTTKQLSESQKREQLNKLLLPSK